MDEDREVGFAPAVDDAVHQQQQRHHHSRIVSGESADDEDIYSDDDDDDATSRRLGCCEPLYSINPDNPSTTDELYDSKLDDEDESYVYKHLRGGIQETIQVRRRRCQRSQQQQKGCGTKKIDPSISPTGKGQGKADHDDVVAGSLSSIREELVYTTSVNRNDDNRKEGEDEVERNDGDNDNEEAHQQYDADVVETVQVYKPRNTDAVLSCPCCFNIVCMDCQRHKKYVNQFRAMFVMNIVVDWSTKLVYDKRLGGLTETVGINDIDAVGDYPRQQPPQLLQNEIPGDSTFMLVDGNNLKNNVEPSTAPSSTESYYSVLCDNCRTQVAALDMRDEVYHFYGCLESS